MTLLHEALVCVLWEVVISMIVIMMVDRWMKHDCDFSGVVASLRPSQQVLWTEDCVGWNDHQRPNKGGVLSIKCQHGG